MEIMQNDLFSKSEVPSMCLRDVERTEAFRTAINKVVKPGDVVLDAGAGSGILSFFAAAAGARKVYAVEYDSGLADLLRQNAARNGFAEIIEVIAGDVRELRLPVATSACKKPRSNRQATDLNAVAQELFRFEGFG